MEDRRTARDPNRSLTVKEYVRDKKIDVTAETFKSWVEDTIAEWLPGYTGTDHKTNNEYKITHVGGDLYLVEEAPRLIAERAPRAFHVVVHVVEQP